MKKGDYDQQHCPICDVEVAQDATTCANCGARQSAVNWAIKAISIVAFVIAFFSGVFLLAGILGVIKHAHKNYTVLICALLFFGITLYSALRLSALSAMKKFWRHPKF